MANGEYLSNSIDSADIHVQYNAHAIRILKDKQILSRILINSVKEFRDYSIEEAIAAIEKEPEIQSRYVRQNIPDAIKGGNTVSEDPSDGTLRFDIVFYALTRNKDRRKIYINVEAQKNFYPGYDLAKRGVFYAARLLSQQLDTEFTSDNYNDIKKVYSIWVCFNTPVQNQKHQDIANTITEIHLAPNVLYGSSDNAVVHSGYDLLSVIFICLDTVKDDAANGNELLGMLSTLFSNMKPQKKKAVLRDVYGFDIPEEMSKEVQQMCNLSYGIEERAIAENDAKWKAILDAKEAEVTKCIAEAEKREAEAEKREAELISEIERLKAELAAKDN